MVHITNPILNFRTLIETELTTASSAHSPTVINKADYWAVPVNYNHTMITKTREAADSAETSFS